MPNKYIYYKLNVNESYGYFKLLPDYHVIIHSPNLFSLNLHTRFKFINLFWYVFTLGRYKIYYIYDKNKIVHFSYVMPKIFKFGFMKHKNSVHIGPCWTHEEYRGKGIYPAVLSKICADYFGKDIYIFTDIGNIPSQKGIKKVGFKQIGQGYKSKFLGIYKINND